MPATTALFPWLQERSAGILLHPTALPGPHGIGQLGANAHRFLGFLTAAHVRHWQMCPLGPTGYGDSPYQCFSSFAGNPYLIDPAPLVERGLLRDEELAPLRALPAARVDYGRLYHLFWPILRRAHERFLHAPGALADWGEFEEFKHAQRAWLHPYALFAGLKEQFGGGAWLEWPLEFHSYHAALSQPLPPAAAAAAAAHEFYQFVFYAQWRQLRERAAAAGVSLVGDIPIFVALDSADVWAHPELFQLDRATGRPTAVAGVPPDYFSPLGQLWGNPLYDWDAHRGTHFAWWLERLRHHFEMYDVLRLDHFRGFDEYWAVPAGAPDARQGAWRPGPGLAFFEALREKHPGARIIAEDLGLITDSVIALREATGLPGMAVLQFAFGSGSDNPHLPHNLKPNCVVYSGTHDNDTTVGWYRAAGPRLQDEFRRYLRAHGDAPHWDLIHAAFKSVCRLAVTPLQDVFGLGGDARFNSPGRADGNWQWRFSEAQFDFALGSLAGHLCELADNAGRQAPRAPLAQRPKNSATPGTMLLAASSKT